MTTYLDLWTLLASYGICFGLMNDKAKPLTDRLRGIRIRVRKTDEEETTFFSRMFHCPYCTGFHCGWLVWLLRCAEGGQFPVAGTMEWAVGGNVASVLLAAFAAAVFCYVVDTATQWFEAAIR